MGAPANYREALNLLLDRCPELLPAWHELIELHESADPDEVGIYNVIGTMVLPVVAYLLGDPDSSGLPSRDPSYAALPPLGSPGSDALLYRIFAVLDEWAGSSDQSLRQAVSIEFIESGYASLSRRDLTRCAGPVLKEWAEAAAQPPTPEQRQRQADFDRWVRRKYGGVAACPACGSQYVAATHTRRLDDRVSYENRCLSCHQSWTVKLVGDR